MKGKEDKTAQVDGSGENNRNKRRKKSPKQTTENATTQPQAEQNQKRVRTSPYPGQVMPSLFDKRKGLSSGAAEAPKPDQPHDKPQGSQEKKKKKGKERAQVSPHGALPSIHRADSVNRSASEQDTVSLHTGEDLPAVRMIALGGLNEIGKNLTVLECGGDMLVIDCGLAFPDDTMPGVDLVIPDISYLVKNKELIRGILITHGHEDHVGALPYALRELDVPVYCTRLTSGLIKNKLEEHRLTKKARINLIQYGDRISLGCFEVEVIRSNHSIPDACAFCIETPAGRIIHTGDFKIDLTPIDGEMMDLARIGELGRQGVLALLCDSTNALREGNTRSERIVGASLNVLFASTDKRIIVTTFASNIHRVVQIIEAAERHDRKVAISGRSLINNMRAATDLGVVSINQRSLIDLKDIENYPPKELVIVSTGSQGEPMSALYRMAFADHRNVEIGSNDLVILSASPVPGNEEMVSHVVNELVRRGAEVITHTEADVHVSGHASKEEHKLLIGMVRPRYFIPVHGEYRHMAAAARTAMSMGVQAEHVVLSDIGKVVELRADGWRFCGNVPAGRVLVDGSGVGDVGNVVLRDRMSLSESGLIVVAAVIDSATRRLVAGPDVVSRGFVYVRESEALIEGVRECSKDALERSLLKGANVASAKNEVRDAVGSFVQKQTRRNPVVLAILMET